MVAAIGWNVVDLLDRRRVGDARRSARSSAWPSTSPPSRSCCWPATSSGPGCGAAPWSRPPQRWSPAWRSASWSAGDCSSCSPARWTATTGWPTRQPGRRLRRRRLRAFDGQHPHVFVNALLGLFGALALMAAAVVLFRSQRADDALTGDDESAIRALLELTARTTRSATSPPAATRRWSSRPTDGRDHLPRRGRRLPGQRRPGRRPEGVAPGHRGLAAAVPGLRLGARRDGRRSEAAPGVPRGRAQRPPARRRGDPAPGQLPAGRTRTCARSGRPSTGPGAPALTVRIRRHRDLTRRGDGRGHQPGRRLARHRDRTRLLDGAGPARRPGRRRLPARRGRAARRRGDHVVAMLSFVPWGTNGISLDLMRRSPHPPTASWSSWSPSCACRPKARRQPDLAELRGVPLGLRGGRPARRRTGARLWRGLLVFFSRWWQLETLYRSNMKYQPEWFPRFLCYEDAGWSRGSASPR